jgi:IS5 family transposase
MSQLTFSALEHQSKKKRTRREEFLSEMDKVIPWARLEGLIAPHYPKSTTGRPRMKLSTMLRVYFLQQWYGLSDPGAEEALYDSDSMRRFAQIELASEPVPDESTIMNFRHLLEKKKLTEKMFKATGKFLAERGLILRSGTIVDATIIHAPNSTKNEEKRRDPEMSSTKKSGQWHFGMKAHIGTDKKGIVHSLVCTTAKTQESTVMEDLLHGDEDAVYGDKAYSGETVKERLRLAGKKPRCWLVAKRGCKHRELTKAERERNRRFSGTRAFVEHPFLVVKHLWRYTKTRYRGLEKNAAQLYTLFALSNLYRLREQLMHP